MRKRTGIILGIVILLILSGYYLFSINPVSRGYINKLINKIEGKTLNDKFESKIKSGNLSTDYNVETAIADIEKLGLNTINIPIVVNIDNLNSSDMNIYENSLLRATWLLKELRGTGINIIIEPYPWISNGSEVETEWNPDNKEEFFKNWKEKVLKRIIDEIAVPYHVDALSIGTSLTQLEGYEEELCDLVDYSRQYYKGLITYRTSFWVTADWEDEATKEMVMKLNEDYQKKLNNKVFSKVDFISIATYFELTENDTNTVENLVSALESSQRYKRKQPIKEQIENFYTTWNKPIFFGELGFPRTEKATVEPWNPYLSNKINNQEQANGFEAYKRVFQNEAWNLGFSIFAIGEKSPEKLYYPSDETTEIIKSWYISK